MRRPCGQGDLLMLRLKQGLIELPPAPTIEEFLQQDGKGRTPEEARPLPVVTLALLKDRHLETHGNGAMEANSLPTVSMHLGHFQRSLGTDFPLPELQMPHLQPHLNARMKKRYRGRPPSPATLKKEIASFRAAWNWAVNRGLVTGVFPARGLVYAKSDKKPAFMTRVEIDRMITAKTTAAAQAELWECLYLRADELPLFLEYVKAHAAHRRI